MTEDIQHYRRLVEGAYTGTLEDGAATSTDMDPNNPAHVAELVRDVFSQGGVDKHTLRDALLGHKNDPKFALEVLHHLSV